MWTSAFSLLLQCLRYIENWNIVKPSRIISFLNFAWVARSFLVSVGKSKKTSIHKTRYWFNRSTYYYWFISLDNLFFERSLQNIWLKKLLYGTCPQVGDWSYRQIVHPFEVGATTSFSKPLLTPYSLLLRKECR